MILDTNFVIALRRDAPGAAEKGAEIEAAKVPLRLPTVVVHELYVGVGAGSEPTRNVREYEALVGNKPIVPLDQNIARRAGALEGQHLASDAKPDLGLADAVVAATGSVYNEAIVTDDTSDFGSIDGLRVETF
jgi:predicted nucleic acid-binding protein